MGKTEFIQKIRVEPERKARYLRALAHIQKEEKVGSYVLGRGPTFSEWVLGLLDREASAILK